MKIPCKADTLYRGFSALRYSFAFISIILRISSGVKVLLRLNLARYSIFPFVPRIGDMAIPPKNRLFSAAEFTTDSRIVERSPGLHLLRFSDLMPRRLKLRFYKADTKPLRL